MVIIAGRILSLWFLLFLLSISCNSRRVKKEVFPYSEFFLSFDQHLLYSRPIVIVVNSPTACKDLKKHWRNLFLKVLTSRNILFALLYFLIRSPWWWHFDLALFDFPQMFPGRIIYWTVQDVQDARNSDIRELLNCCLNSSSVGIIFRRADESDDELLW